MAGKRQEFTVAIICANCGTPGAVVWEEAGDQHREHGPQRRLISLHGEFHRESGRTRSGDPLIICNACDEIQPD
jgi:hypothetical protein